MKILGKQLTATAVAAEVKVNCQRLLLTNDGESTIYLSIELVEDYPETVVADADSYFPLGAGEVLSLESEARFTSVNYICGAGQTSYLRIAAWR